MEGWLVRTRAEVSNEMAEEKKCSCGDLDCLVEVARAVLMNIYVRQTKRRQKEMVKVPMTTLFLTSLTLHVELHHSFHHSHLLFAPFAHTQHTL